jgi:outer membrane immunogenic protein
LPQPKNFRLPRAVTELQQVRGFFPAWLTAGPVRSIQGGTGCGHRTTADHWLFYGTGGLAYGNAKFSNVSVATVTLTSAQGVVTSNTLSTGFSGSTTRVGWTVGGGIEKAFNRNWSVKAEYLYVDLGGYTFAPNTAFATDVRLRDHIARIGINYKFDTGPVVAKY